MPTRHSGARFGRAGGDRLCAGIRHPVRARHHPLALCRPHLHPAGDKVRHLGVKLKHNANRALIKGKRIVLIDDSIVRGTTSLKIVQMMRDAGAPKCICASPPADAAQLLLRRRHARARQAARRAHDVAEMAKLSSAPTAWRSSRSTACTRRWAKPADIRSPQYCDACFTGDYPTPLTDQECAATPIPVRIRQRSSSLAPSAMRSWRCWRMTSPPGTG
jgi:glutamine phosphoribosylpyrophosphate amidotransferase